MSFLRPVWLRPLSPGVRDWGMGAGVVGGVAFRAAAQQGEAGTGFEDLPDCEDLHLCANP